MISRLAYGPIIILLLAVFALLMGLKMIPYQQSRYRYEPVAVDSHALAIAWALDRSDRPDEVATLPVQVPESFRFKFPFFNMQRQVEDSALKVLVKTKLPDTGAYVLKLSGNQDSIMLPLARQADGTSATPAFVVLETGDTGRYFHGVRVFHAHGESCQLAVERVVKL